MKSLVSIEPERKPLSSVINFSSYTFHSIKFQFIHATFKLKSICEFVLIYVLEALITQAPMA